MAHILYRLDFASGKSYVGQTVRALNIRINAHRTAANRGSMLPVHCAWRAHGAPVVTVVGEFESHDELHAAEIALIESLGTMSPGGYNVSRGGDTAPYKNPEVAAKIAEKAKGRKVENVETWRESSLKNWQEPEYREKVSTGLKASWTEKRRAEAADRMKARMEQRQAEGWTMPEHQREKLRNKVVSEETRRRMSESAKKRGLSDEFREKAAAANRGKKLGAYSDDRKQKAAAGIKAAWQDPEKRARLMAARKEAWETRRSKQKESA